MRKWSIIVTAIVTILGIISALITILQGWNDVLNAFEKLIGLVVKFIGLLKIEIQLPLWSIILIFICGLIIPIIFWGISTYKTRSVANYTKDVISGLIWEKGNPEYTGTINLKSFCPKCQTEIDTRGNHNTKLVCSGCNTLLPCDSASFDIIQISKEFEHRERTGEWKSARRRLKQLKN
jgi:hypothetical protein